MEGSNPEAIPALQCGQLSKALECLFQLQNVTGSWPCVLLESASHEQQSQVLRRTLSHVMVGFEMKTVLLYCLSAFGIVGSVLCICTMSHLSYRQHRVFRTLLTTVCCADLCFNALNFSVTYVEANWRFCVSDSVLPMHFLRFTKGLVQSISLFCDFSTALLALERYLSICKPIFWHTVNKTKKMRLCCTSLAAAALTSGMRFTYSFTNDVLCIHTNDTSASSYCRMLKNGFYFSSTFEVVNLVAGIGIPCTLTAVIVFSTINVILGIKRRAQIHHLGLQWSSVSAKLMFFVIGRKLSSLTVNTVHEQKLKEARNRAMLIVVTSVGFLFDQLSYMLSTMCYLFEMSAFRSAADREAPVAFSNLRLLTAVAMVKIVCAVMESLAHTVNFYAYVLFNETFRERLSERITCADSRQDSV